jgi:hypothetical protein
VRSTVVTQVSTPSAAAFQARSNKAEVVAEHIGSKSNQKPSNETKKTPLILFKNFVKPYKYMYQTIYKRANGLLICMKSNNKMHSVFFL